MKDTKSGRAQVRHVKKHLKSTAMSRAKFLFDQSTPEEEGEIVLAKRSGFYANLAAKRHLIKAGSKEEMCKPGTQGAPTAKALRDSAKTAKKRKRR